VETEVYDVRLRTSDTLAVLRHVTVPRHPGEAQATVFAGFNAKEVAQLVNSGVEVRVTPLTTVGNATVSGMSRVVVFPAFGQAPLLTSLALMEGPAGGILVRLSFSSEDIDCTTLQSAEPRVVVYARGPVPLPAIAVLAADLQECNTTAAEGPIAVLTANFSSPLNVQLLDGAVAVAASLAGAGSPPSDTGLLLAGTTDVAELLRPLEVAVAELTASPLNTSAVVLRWRLASSGILARTMSATHTYSLRNADTGVVVASGSLVVPQLQLVHPLSIRIGGLDGAVAYTAQVAVTFEGPALAVESARVPVRPLPSPPPAVTALRVTNITAHSAKVSWSHVPTDLETQYQFTLNRGDATELSTLLSPAMLELEQLAPLTKYKVTVRHLVVRSMKHKRDI
jgi:hypothetical protein